METADANRTRHGEQDGAPSRRLRSLSSRELLREARSIPNLLTLLRMASVPVLVWTLLADHALAALVLFAAAALSDGVDGLLARLLNQRTTLGAYLDPIADKLLTLSALTALCIDRRLPWWMLGVVLLRDGGIVVAALALRLTGRDVPAAPTRLGKYATFFLLLTMTLAFAGKLDPARSLAAPIAAFGMLAAVCVLGACLQYYLRWRRLMLAPPPSVRPVAPAAPPARTPPLARPPRPPPARPPVPRSP